MLLSSFHEHVRCPPDRREWLEARADEAATMRPHFYCNVCGKVERVEGTPPRTLGYFLKGLAALKEHLGRSAHHDKMTQCQSRLIAKALQDVEALQDPYGLSLEMQSRLYLRVVRTFRPDLGQELVLRTLPKIRRRPRRPVFETMTASRSPGPPSRN